MTDRLDFQALFDASPNPYMVMDTGLMIVTANPTYLRMTGRTLADIVGRYVFDAFPVLAGASNELEGSMRRVVATGEADVLAVLHYPIPGVQSASSEPLTREHPARAPIQDRYWSITHSPVCDADGRLAFILQQSVDVTRMQRLKAAERERQQNAHRGYVPIEQDEAGVLQRARAVQQANRSLGEERRQLRKMFEAAPGFMCFLRGPQLVFELANRSFLSLIGHRELIGKPLRRALPELLAQGVVQQLEAAYDSGNPVVGSDTPLRVGTASLLSSDAAHDEQVFIDYVIQPVTDPNGRVSGLFVQGHNVTAKHLAISALQRETADLEGLVRESVRALRDSEAERRHAEAALAHAQKMEAVGQLTGGVAHDFNNVLQIISGNLQLIGHDVDSGALANVARRLDSAISAVKRGARLASQLLTFARRQPLEPSVVDPAALCDAMVELLRRLLGETIHIETRINADVAYALVDANHLENVLLNLAVNARDAMNGEGTLLIEVDNAVLDEDYAQRHPGVLPGDYVTFALTDNGCGMAPDVLERVFEPFYTTKPQGQGTGLGLSMAYGFAKQSNGYIRIDSEVGQGTTARLYLPRTDQALPVSTEDGIETSASETLRGRTILVVEDDDEVRRTVVDMLLQLGYRVLESINGDCALAILESSAGAEVDLLFSDVVMPGGLRGNALLQAARRLHPHLEVLFTSGYANEEIVHAGRLDDGLALIAKPYGQEDLARKLAGIFQAQTVVATSRPQRRVDRVATLSQNTVDHRVAAKQTHILLVEDDPNTLASTAELLVMLGHRISMAESAEMALSVAHRDPFDILMTDLTLPGMSGVDLIEALSLPDGGAPIASILATGYGGADDARPPPPGTVLLQKPYDLSALERALTAALRRERQPVL